jgi:peptidoglycan-associated lipoprotein
MIRVHGKTILVLAGLMLVVAIEGCSKKVAKATPPPAPPPPAAPTATLAATPNAIQQGQSTDLTWSTDNATEVTIDGLGTVPASGTRAVQPTESTTYQLLAKGPGGAADASARVTVTNPPPVTQAAPAESAADMFARNVKDIFFDYDKYGLREDQQGSANGNAQFLASHSNIQFEIEGHCDDRGSAEYNLALGDSRAQTVKDYLVRSGVSADRIHVISYGKERPFCTEDNDQCWQENRRAHFVFLEQSAEQR